MERHTLWPVQCMVADTAVLSWWSFTVLSFKPGIFLIQEFIDLVRIFRELILPFKLNCMDYQQLRI